MSTRGQGGRTSPLSEGGLRSLVQLALERGYYRETCHAEHDHPERNISADDVIHGLERRDWKLAEAPDYDEEFESWEYLVQTVDIEGDELHLKIAAYPDERRIAIISRW
jgi:hypothetical protein